MPATETVNKIMRIVNTDQNTLANIEREIADTKRQINDYINELNHCQNRLCDLNDQKSSFYNDEELLREKATELIRYLDAADNISYEIYDDNTLYFEITTTLFNFDAEYAKMEIDDEDSPFNYEFTRYNDCCDDDDQIDEADYKAVLNEIFADNGRYRLRFIAEFLLHTDKIEPIDHGSDWDNFDDKMGNPHLMYYACLGGNRLKIENACIEGNYIAAIEQCALATANLNIGDSVVLEKFTQELLLDWKMPMIEDSYNGDLLSPEELAAIVA